MGENIQKPRPVVLGRGDANGVGSLHANDVHGVQPLVPGLHLELHRLPFGESLEPVHLDGRKMHEHVLAAILLNEAVVLRIIEPLHLSLGHSFCLMQSPTPSVCARPTPMPSARPRWCAPGSLSRTRALAAVSTRAG